MSTSSIKKYNQIVIFTAETYPSVAGDGRNALLVGSKLAAKGHRVLLISLNPNNLLQPYETINGVQIERVAYNYKTKLGRAILRLNLLWHLQKLKNPKTIWLIYGAMPGFRTIMLAAILKGVSFIFRSTLWGFDDAYTLAGKPQKFITRALLNNAKGYYALNSSFVSSWISVFGQANIFKSFQGVELGRFNIKNRNEIRALTRKELGIPPEQPAILMVGHIIHRKGFPEIIDWLGKIDDEYILIHLGSYQASEWDTVSLYNVEMSQHKAYAEKVLGDKIRFLGRQNDTYKFYLASDIFLMASYAEGYPPNSVNEALAAGLPVLTRKIPGVTDTITDGLNGFHFSSEKEFSAKLSSLIHNKTKRIEMGRNAQIFATDKLNINSIVDRLVTFINAI
ncbi:MAG: hypothetical protein PWR03_1564 [Tenuifilum sp.]|jgi:glycosyltransferase involved in cell wall biosynthesis|uniref:glycosyltransferase family 4 protein n=1 Tax=Tenuifilum sp. TaxID=2760880 RepID=UPI0024ABB191|nr:glycosyltransferase family 4 protein [Tenuifilum sp.]MDI3527381.1 hypothetical protein [Tenuifilum sp.]